MVIPTGTITVTDPNAKKVAFLYTTASPSTGANKLYSTLVHNYNVTVFATDNITDTAALMTNLKNNFD